MIKCNICVVLRNQKQYIQMDKHNDEYWIHVWIHIDIVIQEFFSNLVGIKAPPHFVNCCKTMEYNMVEDHWKPLSKLALDHIIMETTREAFKVSLLLFINSKEKVATKSSHEAPK